MAEESFLNAEFASDCMKKWQCPKFVLSEFMFTLLTLLSLPHIVFATSAADVLTEDLIVLYSWTTINDGPK